MFMNWNTKCHKDEFPLQVDLYRFKSILLMLQDIKEEKVFLVNGAGKKMTPASHHLHKFRI